MFSCATKYKNLVNHSIIAVALQITLLFQSEEILANTNNIVSLKQWKKKVTLFEMSQPECLSCSAVVKLNCE